VVKGEMKKKSVIAITAMLGLLLLTACGGSKDLSQKDVEKVTYGTKVKDLEKDLGKPTKVLKDSDATTAMQEDAKSLAADPSIATSDAYTNFYSDMTAEELTKISSDLATADKIEIYQYKYKNDDKKEKTKNFYITPIVKLS
jgi:hypothetical protein